MMRYRGYAGKVEFDAEADIFHGEVVGIRDVVTFQGRSVDEIRRAFRESVDDYLAFCRERGEEPDKPCSGNFMVRIGPDLHRRANILANASGKSLNAFVTECLAKEIASRMPKATSASSKASKRPKHKKRPTRARSRS